MRPAKLKCESLTCQANSLGSNNCRVNLSSMEQKSSCHKSINTHFWSPLLKQKDLSGYYDTELKLISHYFVPFGD